MKTNHPLIAPLHDIAEPIRAELFSLERLEQHAESLAAAQIVASKTMRGHPLIPRVRENGRILLDSYRATSLAIDQGRSITPAAEWLVDNFHIVDEQLREIQDDLPAGYYHTLPKLASGHLEGYPRVYGVAWAFVAHTDSRFDPETLRRFVSAYQRVQPLTIGELWAVAITLRVVLIENLRRLAERIVSSRTARQEADRLADLLLGASARPEALAAALAEFENQPMETAFAVQLVQRLRDLDPKVAPVLQWLDKRLADAGTNADDVVHVEHQEQGASNVSVRNIVTSMRSISAFDWPEFFEAVSLVDEILRKDTHFADMDFATRDNYRHAIEDLSRGSKHSEIEVAKRVVTKVLQAASKGSDGSPNGDDPNLNRKTEPGYYLVSRGRPAFERELGFRVSLRRWLLRLYIRGAVPGYLGTIALLTGVLLALPLSLSYETGVDVKGLLLLAVFAAVPASDLAIALINRAVMDSLGPRRLPRLELREIPAELRTIIVVPTLLTTPADVNEQVERLEVHYLANPDGDLRFALLSDWADAASETLPGDDESLAAAVEGILKLNQRHGPAPGGGERFFLFHRKRLWNEREGKWMGWERKRGKLHELNRFLRGATDTTFITNTGQPAQDLRSVRYVITLDADTRLPRGTAARLIGTMAHPLNRPRFSARDGRVVEGYAIVQPRITPALPIGREGSLAQKIYSGPGGIDPYSAAVSDVYQDLFREGSYTGKGIYEVDAFETALAGKVPENSLLSHDLFEGIFARVGLATDIELFEEFPSRYAAIAARQDRWARGDWQLLPWLLGVHRVAVGSGESIKIPAIGRWKMLDNLRRTLSAPATLLTLIAGWALRPPNPWVWMLFIVVGLAIPVLLPSLFDFMPRRKGISWRSHFRGLFGDLMLGAWQIGLTLTFLAYQTWLMSVAILRTLVRLVITHRRLLEWVTAAQAKAQVDLKFLGTYKRMAGGFVVLAATIAVLAFAPHRHWIFAAPLLALWAAAPAVAWWISLPPEREAQALTLQGKQGLRLISRRTWRFFEKFVTSQHHALPPDNFQESPKAVVAQRTSPTNIGLYLLSIVCAHDLGWLGLVEMVERLEATLGTMREMDLFRGHFYNWYDTSDLHPLSPKYVSTVDSGNLAGHLLTLANGCRELMEKPAFEAGVLAGMRDTSQLLGDALARIPHTPRTHVVTRKQLSNAADEIAISLELPPSGALDWAHRFVQWKALTQNAADIAQTLTQERGDAADSDLPTWQMH